MGHGKTENLTAWEYCVGQALNGLIQAYAAQGISPTSNIPEITQEAKNFANEMFLSAKGLS